MPPEITPQKPLGSGFGATTTAREVVAGLDLRGRIALVTGGHAGIGLETTRALAGAGATVVVGARAPERAREALAGMGGVEVDALDLLDPASIDAFARRFGDSRRPLHLLVCNAGIMACPLTRDRRGFEWQLATNHLGHFQLTARLWPALERAGGARVVAVSSRGHQRSNVDLEDPHFERRSYEKWTAYGQSKTANILFAVALDARARKHGVRAFALHPGGIRTDLTRFLEPGEFERLLASLPAGFALKTPEQGAATSVWCATSPRLEGLGGVYCEDADVAELLAGDVPGARGVKPYAIDPAAADRLWAASERWTGVAFQP